MRESAMRKIRWFLFGEGCAFSLAASIHFGALISGYQHQAAGTAESVIAAVLWIGLALAAIFPAATRTVGLTAQGFAAFGTLVGITTIMIGVGPQTIPDIGYHIAILIVLISGLVTAARAKRDQHAQKVS